MNLIEKYEHKVEEIKESLKHCEDFDRYKFLKADLAESEEILDNLKQLKEFKNNKYLNSIVIISDYDCTTSMTVMNNGVITTRSSVNNNINEMDEIYDNINNKEWLRNKFGNKTIVICQDGYIEVIE